MDKFTVEHLKPKHVPSAYHFRRSNTGDRAGAFKKQPDQVCLTYTDGRSIESWG